MTFLPVVERELREASRRRSTYWLRLEAASIALGIGFLILVSEKQSNQSLGSTLFFVLGGFILIQSLFAGAWRTSDCISAEKRDGTLGLLFLTDLKGYDVVFGKLAATSLNVIYGLMAVFPILAIPILLGGVSLAELARVMAVTLNNLFFSLAVGMFSSAICRDERRSMSVALAILLGFTVLIPLGYAVVNACYPDSPLPVEVTMISPGCAAVGAFDPLRMGSASIRPLYVRSLLLVHTLAWAFLLTSCSIVPRSWQEKGRRNASRTRSPEQDKRRTAFRTRLLDAHPFSWVALRRPSYGVAVWTFLGVVALLWAWALWKFPSDVRDSGFYIMTAMLMHSVLKVWLTSEVARRFVLDRQSGALELILSTPLQVPEIISGQLAALWRQFGWPSAVVIAVDIIFFLASRGEIEVQFFLGVLLVAFIGDMIALSWVGMWTAVRFTTVNRAAGAALSRLLVLPWLVLIVIFVLASIANAFGVQLGSWSMKEVMGAALALSLACDFFFGLSARRQLLRQFRERATSA